MDPLKLSELLCARLCHDMAGPVGAAGAGAELLQDGDGADAATIAMVAASAHGAVARLKFLRAALGAAPAAGFRAADIKSLADGYFLSAGGGIHLDWPDHCPHLDGDRGRLLFNLLMLGRESLPRGGRLAVTLDDGGLPKITARGRITPPTVDMMAAMTAGGVPADPRAAQAFLTGAVARGLGGNMKIAVLDDELIIWVEMEGEDMRGLG